MVKIQREREEKVVQVFHFAEEREVVRLERYSVNRKSLR